MPKFKEYDIEVLQNIYTLAVCKTYKNQNGELDIYYLTKDRVLFESPIGEIEVNGKHYVSNQQLAEMTKTHVLMHNPIFHGDVNLYNIQSPEGVIKLLTTFGISNDNTRTIKYNNNKYKVFVHKGKKYPIPEFTRDVDPNFEKESHPFLVSYNGYQYDTTVLAALYDELFTTPNDNGEFQIDMNFDTKALRIFNDQLFTKQFKKSMFSRLRYKPLHPNKVNTSYSQPDFELPANLFRNNMIQSGRYIDAARLNEKMTKVALKRLLGMLGCQIMESDKLKPDNPYIENLEQLLDLFAYNASDVINLHTLMMHKTYISSFELRDTLLEDYPELIYMEKGNTYKPDISPDKVRRDRLYRDSTSQQLTARSLFPYSKVTDYKYVSFMYPSQQKCDELNKKYALEIAAGKRKKMEPRNVLDYLKDFFYDLYPQKELRENFDKIYAFYKNLEGRNFNSSEQYQQDYPNIPAENPYSYPFEHSYICYYDKDGNPTRHYANFSIGGIHGAEWNLDLFKQERQRLFNFNIMLDKIKKHYPNAVDFRKAQVNIKMNGKKSKTGYVLIEGTYYKTSSFLKAGKKINDSEYRDYEIIPDSPFKRNNKGLMELDKKYTYTTVAKVNHEDFTSYYPSMLIMMSVFYNQELGYDRYNEIFEQKEDFGKKMKDKSIDPAIREVYSIKRDGTKLLLNSATGAGGATFDNNISANNAILSMRCIGQFWTYLVGQYQAYYGAGVPSTNTDGLYTIMEETINNQLLEEISEQIGVGIEPEPMYLISKDANNRCEMKIKNDGTLELENSAGSIGCYNGPHPTKSLSHPALVDKVLVDYMIEKAINQKDEKLTQQFDRQLARKLMAQTLDPLDNKTRLTYLQNVLASTNTSYIFASKNVDMSDPQIIQMYNRAFFVTDKNPNHVYLQRATAQAILPATIQKRKRNNEITVQHNSLALSVMNKHGYYDFEENTEATIAKITGVEVDQPMYIYNGDLSVLSHEEAMDIFKYIDVEAYIDLFETAYNNSWKNDVPVYNSDVNPLSDDAKLTTKNIHSYIDMNDKKSKEYISKLKEVA